MLKSSESEKELLLSSNAQEALSKIAAPKALKMNKEESSCCDKETQWAASICGAGITSTVVGVKVGLVTNPFVGCLAGFGAFFCQVGTAAAYLTKCGKEEIPMKPMDYPSYN